MKNAHTHRLRRRRGAFPDPAGFGDLGPGDFGPPAGFGPPGGFGPGGFGPGGPGGFGPGGPRGRRGRGHGHGPRGRARRGNVRNAILLLLAEEPMHGYQIIQEITERSGGAWTPSPGAVYPALGLLTDEGLVEVTTDSGRNLASLTEVGRTYVTEHAEELGSPWDEASRHGPRGGGDLRRAAMPLADAVRQVARVGTEEQVAAAREVLDRARREIYLILARPEGATSDTDAAE